ncbi:MAG: hypothetical protein A2X61_16730 [Ignavibacteria bacterium GWB2_35_12]|nr:MAG: hypothetical protein A2X63_13175 [Ignavibacteria bacterium GWA2_35_8]OGU38002.1 MAG: hypothetical protein A2X61_16730 [Ignavibacteria bacterium GWB2_35_12]OGU95688.1 MAG: hypothetical protein A2220_04380 [Ignavibacteria bacterium RIFOXYA2_FULL_35_10]OGV25077.1 MAG: hypothetical protein A2475_16900 [Ignavibacteria bacterium RIFOXYC2_FULL_35_21]
MKYNTTDLINYRIARAKETIEEAKSAILENHFHLAGNRIYYAIFYYVSALSLKNNYSTSKHKQLLGWFNKNYIHTGKIDIEFGRTYYKAYQNRQTGDYDDMVYFEKEDVIKHFNDMLLFTSEIDKLL